MIELLQLTVWIGAHIDATCADDGQEQGRVENLRMGRKGKVSQEECVVD